MIAKKRKSKKRDYQDIFFTVILGILAVGFIAFLVFSNTRLYGKRRTLLDEVARLKREISAAEVRRIELKLGIENASDKEYLEKVAREKFLLKEEGEEVIVVSPPEQQEEEVAAPKKNFFQQILEKIGL